ncbi:hypothetical protein E3G52_000365 [Mycobacteroides abscessus]|uniref:hypothetical protein n=1 Tax=Mycobacteroides abscessus TaxID=36809 RepID=UPI001877EFF8|nr:hypothetical protein [Mycobacteroides abscessus]MBE5453501.1 hypothetical protein [Mycobacteroides abscessus]
MAKPATRDAVADTVAALTQKRDLLRSLNIDTADIDAKLDEWKAITAPTDDADDDDDGDKTGAPEVEKKTEPTPVERAVPAAPETATAKPVKAAPAKASAPKAAAPAKDADGGTGHAS